MLCNESSDITFDPDIGGCLQRLRHPLSQFFEDDEKVELIPELKELFDNWLMTAEKTGSIDNDKSL